MSELPNLEELTTNERFQSLNTLEQEDALNKWQQQAMQEANTAGALNDDVVYSINEHVNQYRPEASSLAVAGQQLGDFFDRSRQNVSGMMQTGNLVDTGQLDALRKQVARIQGNKRIDKLGARERLQIERLQSRIADLEVDLQDAEDWQGAREHYKDIRDTAEARGAQSMMQRDFGSKVAGAIAGSAPDMAVGLGATAINPMFGGAYMGSVMTAGVNEQLMDTRPDLTAEERLKQSIATGGAMSLLETVGLGKVAKGASQGFGALTNNARREVAEGAIKKIAGTSAVEGATEYGQTLIESIGTLVNFDHDALDQILKVLGDADVQKEAGFAGFIGSLMGGGIQSVSSVVEFLRTPVVQDKIKSIQDEPTIDNIDDFEHIDDMPTAEQSQEEMDQTLANLGNQEAQEAVAKGTDTSNIIEQGLQKSSDKINRELDLSEGEQETEFYDEREIDGQKASDIAKELTELNEMVSNEPMSEAKIAQRIREIADKSELNTEQVQEVVQETTKELENIDAQSIQDAFADEEYFDEVMNLSNQIEELEQKQATTTTDTSLRLNVIENLPKIKPSSLPSNLKKGIRGDVPINWLGRDGVSIDEASKQVWENLPDNMREEVTDGDVKNIVEEVIQMNKTEARNEVTGDPKELAELRKKLDETRQQPKSDLSFEVSDGTELPSGAKKKGIEVELLKDGENIGIVQAEELDNGDTLQIYNSAIIDESVKGTGQGKKMYDMMVEEAKKRGYKRIISDASVSSNASKQWEKRGATKNPNAKFEKASNPDLYDKWVAGDKKGEWVYEINLEEVQDGEPISTPTVDTDSTTDSVQFDGQQEVETLTGIELANAEKRANDLQNEIQKLDNKIDANSDDYKRSSQATDELKNILNSMPNGRLPNPKYKRVKTPSMTGLRKSDGKSNATIKKDFSNDGYETSVYEAGNKVAEGYFGTQKEARKWVDDYFAKIKSENQTETTPVETTASNTRPPYKGKTKTYTSSNGNKIEVTNKGEGDYTFKVNGEGKTHRISRTSDAGWVSYSRSGHSTGYVGNNFKEVVDSFDSTTETTQDSDRRYEKQDSKPSLYNRDLPYREGVSQGEVNSNWSDVVRALGNIIPMSKIRAGGYRDLDRVRGFYNTRTGSINLKNHNDIMTLMHEIGHGVYDQILDETQFPSNVKTELRKAGARHASEGDSDSVVMDEGFADFLRDYLQSQRVAQNLYPNTYAYFTESVLPMNPTLRSQIDLASKAYANLIDMTALQQGVASIIDESKIEKQAQERDRRSDKVLANWIDSDAPLNTLVKELLDEGGWKGVRDRFVGNAPSKNMKPSDDIRLLSRGVATSTSVSNNMIEDGIRGNTTISAYNGQSLKDIIPKDRLERAETEAYLKARTVSERYHKGDELVNGEGEKVNLTNDEKKALDDAGYKVPTQKSELLTPKLATAIIKEYETKYGKEHANELNSKIKKWNEDVILYAYENDVITQTEYEAFSEMTGYYFPMRRATINRRQGAPVNGLYNPFHSVEGQTLETLSGFDALERNMTKIVREAKKKAMYESLIRLEAQADKKGQLIEKIDREDRGMDNVISFIRKYDQVNEDGKTELIKERVYYQVNNRQLADFFNGNELMAEAGVGGSDVISNTAGAISRSATKLLRDTATNNPVFALSTIAIDTMTAPLQSQLDFDYRQLPIANLISGTLAMNWDKQTRADYKAMGVSQSTFRNQRPVKRGFKWADWLLSENYLARGMNRFYNAVEQVQRFNEFKIAYEQGLKKFGSREEALLYATDNARNVTQDFSRKGLKASEVNKHSAFFTASIGGTRQILQTLATKKGAQMFGALVLLPEIALTLINYDDEEYKKRPEWEKERYWHIPMKYFGGEDSEFIKVQKPRGYGELAYYMTSFFKESEAYANKQENPITATIKSQLMMMIPTMVKPVMEHVTNYSSFRDKHLISPYMQRRSKEHQFTPSTSETAKALSRKTDGLISPILIEHYVNSFTTRYGQMGFSALDSILFDGTKDTRSEKSFLLKNTIGGLYTSGTTYESANLFDLKEARENLIGLKADLKDDTPAQRKERMIDNRDLLRRETAINSAYKRIRELSDRAEKIAESDLSDEEKHKRISETWNRVDKIARRALGRK